LSSDTTLTDLLIDLQTGGKGLPDTEDGFKLWLDEVRKDDKMKGIAGEWSKRVNKQLREVIGK
jgi:hypothetical protein